MFGRSSMATRMPAALNLAASSSTHSITSSPPWAFTIGMMTTCVGATLGGRTSPLSSEWVMISAPRSLVETPHEVAHTNSLSSLSFVNCTSKAFAKFCPRKCEVPAWRAQPFCIIASIVNVSDAPANLSMSLFRPGMTGIARRSLATSAYCPSIASAVSRASPAVAWAVCPSCHRNSADLRNGRVRSSQRTTLAHWLIFSGRSRWLWIQFLNMYQIIVSLVGRTMRGSSSLLSGSGSSPLPSGSTRSLWCVTTAHSLANPSTCSASLERKDWGMNSGKYAFCVPVALMRLSSSSRRDSQMAIPVGRMTMQPFTGEFSMSWASEITSRYHCE
mmetsp:Transcript_25646/g.61787  ORF Transcript_25646/g.61787 Transcript_25646/m.61787 type:complete len:331 (+) Transcript_25646:617-1609(+)